jgi:hypothetical protein
VSGATSPTLTIRSLSLQDTGSYQLLATNDVGTARSVSVRISVGKRSQSISFPTPQSVVAGQTVTLNASASSGLPVEYKLVSGAALLTSNTVVPQQGIVVIEADQRGDANYDAAPPAMQTINMMPGSPGTRIP